MHNTTPRPEATALRSGDPPTIAIDPEFESLIPPLADDELAALRERLRAEGCRDALVTWRGLLLDGHHRYRLCTELGIPFRTVAVDLPDREAAKVWIVDTQLARRNLPPVLKVKLALLKEDLLRAQARARQVAAGERGKEGGRGHRKDTDQGQETLVANLPQGFAEPDGRTRDALAALAGVSGRTVDKAKVVLREGPPAIVALAERGEVTVHDAYQATRLLAGVDASDRDAVAAAAVAHYRDRAETAPITLSRAVATIIQDRCVDQTQAAHGRLIDATAALQEPAGPFRTIVVDPPWPMEKIRRDVYPTQVELDYPTMTLEELRAFDLPARLADTDCHLFLWTTQRFLPHSFSVLEAWGFRYVFTMVWHKSGGFQPFGLPQYNCEFVVYGRRGTPTFTDLKDFPTCFSAPRREHSRKPDAFYDLVRRVCPGPRLDVFSREPREGFEQYGNEPNKFV